MARLLGTTRRRVNWAFWISLLIVLAILAVAGTWLAGVLTHLAG
jgi:type III secretory pathway component EscS